MRVNVHCSYLQEAVVNRYIFRNGYWHRRLIEHWGAVEDFTDSNQNSCVGLHWRRSFVGGDHYEMHLRTDVVIQVLSGAQTARKSFYDV